MRLALVPVFVERPSPLHAARAGASASLCLALALVAALYENPIVLGAAIAAALAAGIAAGVGEQLGRAARIAIPLMLLVCVVNPLVYTDGATLLVRGSTLLGHRFDITLEALAYGGFAALRVGALTMAFGLFSACVDPDELLGSLRRVSYRSALTAALATRLVPVLVRDTSRMGDAVRCRARAPERLAVLRAALAGSLDRAVDVAAALEVRGYSHARRPARRRRALSRHDVAVGGCALAVAALAIGAKVAGLGAVDAYPRLAVAAGPGELAFCLVLLACVALPFAGRSARLGVGRA